MSLGIRGLAYLVHVVSLVCALVNCGRHIIFCVRLLDGEILFFLNFFFLSRMVGCWHTAISKGVPIFCFGVVKIRNLSHSLLRRHEKKKKNDSCEIEIMFFLSRKSSLKAVCGASIARVVAIYGVCTIAFICFGMTYIYDV